MSKNLLVEALEKIDLTENFMRETMTDYEIASNLYYKSVSVFELVIKNQFEKMESKLLNSDKEFESFGVRIKFVRLTI